MNLANIEIPDNFFFDIVSIPGSSDEVCQMAINHYQNQLNNNDLEPKLKEIAKGIINALTEYYKMASIVSLTSENSNKLLKHISSNASIMESKTSPDVDVEYLARIKSFYSTYVKIWKNIKKCVEKNKPIPTTRSFKRYLGNTCSFSSSS